LKKIKPAFDAQYKIVVLILFINLLAYLVVLVLVLALALASKITKAFKLALVSKMLASNLSVDIMIPRIVEVRPYSIGYATGKVRQSHKELAVSLQQLLSSRRRR